MAVASVFGRRIIFTTAVIGIGKILGHFQKFRLVAWTTIFGKARWEVEWSHSCRRYQCRASACTITINTQLTQAVVYCNDIVIKDRRHRWSSLVQFTGSVKVQMVFFFLHEPRDWHWIICGDHRWISYSGVIICTLKYSRVTVRL